MNGLELKRLLTTNKYIPIKCFSINNSYLLGIYQGSFSEYDLLLKFRQRSSKSKSGWTRLRTPKHIHWTVDILLKLSHSPDLTKEFINFLISEWDKVLPNQNIIERDNVIKVEDWLNENMELLEKYKILNNHGEYSIKFLISLAKLLMQQEKNNNPNAYFFKKLLDALKEGKDLHKIISTSTHR